MDTKNPEYSHDPAIQATLPGRDGQAASAGVTDGVRDALNFARAPI
jgi:hypothetical protein